MTNSLRLWGHRRSSDVHSKRATTSRAPPHVVVISSRMLMQRFGKAPVVIGRRIALDRESYEIVGVMPAGFYPAPDYPNFWTPHWADQGEKENRNIWGLFPLARLKPGVRWQQAQTELDVVSARMSHDHSTSESVGGIVVPMDAQLIGSSWKLLLLLAVGVTLLLLIACVNVAIVLFAIRVDSSLLTAYPLPCFIEFCF
jgi:hypothetical protein